MQLIQEGKAKIKIEKAAKISREMDVFYNPIMKFNRDISILLLNSLNKKNMQIADTLAASGIRSIRFLKELKKGIIENISINDHSKKAVNLIRNNLKLNKIKQSKDITIKNQDANLFLINSTGFDYIDIDPFGTPNPFLDSAVKRISREGILAVTATDTAALCGTFPDACIRKYWAIPQKGPIMHEIGLRILIRKVQMIGAQFEKALLPIFSYSKEHYMRVFLLNVKGKKEVDKILNQHKMFNNAGPLWIGQLWDKKLSIKMQKNASIDYPLKNSEMIRFLEIIKEESKVNSVGIYDIHELCSQKKIKNLPKINDLIKKIRKKGYKASKTHFKGEAIRSDISEKELVNLIL